MSKIAEVYQRATDAKTAAIQSAVVPISIAEIEAMRSEFEDMQAQAARASQHESRANDLSEAHAALSAEKVDLEERHAKAIGALQEVQTHLDAAQEASTQLQETHAKLRESETKLNDATIQIQGLNRRIAKLATHAGISFTDAVEDAPGTDESAGPANKVEPTETT